MEAGIAVIGGGIAGLIAALEIARLGRTVTMFEATSKLGGRAQTREHGGFYLNQGPHALYRAGAFNRALQEFAVPVTGAGPDLGRGFAIWDGGTFPFPLRASGGAPAPLDNTEAYALAAFFTRMSSDSSLGAGVALGHVLQSLPRRPATVIAALVRLSTYVDALDQIDGKAALDQLRLSFAGTIYVDGGWRTLIEGLAAAAEKAGVDVRLGARVSAVARASNGSITVEAHDGSIGEFAAAVLAVPPKAATKVLTGAGQLMTAAAATRPIRLISLDLALSGLPDPAVKFALGFDEPTYLSVHSAVAALAPAGGAMMHVARYLQPDDRSYSDRFIEVERVADRLQPGWRSAVVHEQKLSGAVVAYDYPRAASAGARARVEMDDVPGIFLAGDWVGQEGMLADAAAASARAAAQAAVAYNVRINRA